MPEGGLAVAFLSPSPWAQPIKLRLAHQITHSWEKSAAATLEIN